MGVHMYLACDVEYQRGLAHELLSKGIIDFCLADHFPWIDSPKHDDRIVEVDHRPSGDEEYDEVCDINELPALSKDLMEKMLPYESAAIRAGMRRLNHPTTEYEEEKRKYLQHVRYWNYMFDRYSINLIVTTVTPHSQGMIVVYGLSKVKNIPMLIWCKCGTFPWRCFWGDALETMGQSIGERYEELKEKDVEGFELEDDIVKGFENAKKEITLSSRAKYNKSISNNRAAFYKKSYKELKKLYFRKYIRSIIRSIVKTKSLVMHEKKGIWFRTIRRHLFAYKYYKKHIECSLKKYDTFAEEADMNKKYIIFLPQMFPEANILPRAGVFGEQYNSIQLLARSCEKADVYVYVKEHPQVPGRSMDFYDEIRFIKNVRLIKSDVSSYELMMHSIGVATQTGTCIWEALAIGKPVLVFGQGYYWKKCPGIIEVVDEIQGTSVVKSLLDGYSISQEELKRYLYAIQLETLMDVDPEEARKRVFDSSYVAGSFDLSDRVHLIQRFIRAKDI